MHRGAFEPERSNECRYPKRKKLSIGWKSFVVRVNELLNNGKGSISVKKSGLPAVEMG